MDGLDEDDLDVLITLREEERANPYLIREQTGLDKGTVNTCLNRLGRKGYVRQVTRGLYEITDVGRESLNGDEPPLDDTGRDDTPE